MHHHHHDIDLDAAWVDGDEDLIVSAYMDTEDAEAIMLRRFIVLLWLVAIMATVLCYAVVSFSAFVLMMCRAVLFCCFVLLQLFCAAAVFVLLLFLLSWPSVLRHDAVVPMLWCNRDTF